jgi:DNA-binding NarL/FixJ family response regulator
VVEPVRVLVVDDQDVFRRALAAVVDETDGFAVAGFASSGEESIEVAAALAPDLVLMDVNLPGIDGIAATRLLAARTPHPPVVLLSTYEEADFGGRAAECGALAYVTKSAFGPDRLRAVWAGAGR